MEYLKEWSWDEKVDGEGGCALHGIQSGKMWFSWDRILTSGTSASPLQWVQIYFVLLQIVGSILSRLEWFGLTDKRKYLGSHSTVSSPLWLSRMSEGEWESSVVLSKYCLARGHCSDKARPRRVVGMAGDACFALPCFALSCFALFVWQSRSRLSL